MVHYIDDYPGREITINGKRHLYFGGTSYLGLQLYSPFQDTLIRNIKKYGTNYGASRNSNVRLSVYKKAEGLLAKLSGCETTITLSSGYLAGQLVSQHYNSSEYRLFYSPNTHAALYTNSSNSFDSYEALKKVLEVQLATNAAIVPVILLDSIDFEGINFPNFEALQTLPLDKVILVVDDSHGIGLTGTDGTGSFPLLKKMNPKELIVSCSLGKSFGIQAGAVLGSTRILKQLTDTDLFGGASPAAPASLATFIESQNIYDQRRALLKANTQLFIDSIEDMSHFISVDGHPSFTIKNTALTLALEERGFVLTNFNYPRESSSHMGRIVISSHHTKADIESLASAINAL